MRVITLGQLTPEDVRGAGGKARGLDALVKAGFNVPPGWAVLEPDSDPATLLDAWRAAGSPPVAVRSSAALEDGAVASFAGQFLTLLDVRTEGSLRDALTRVAASQRKNTAYGESAGAPAVVVQEMVEPELAGVAFGRDPATGDGAVIEAVRGRGDALVSGAATPDRLRIEGTKRVGSTPLVRELERDLLARLAELEKLFGAPQDVEWAVRKGRLWLLQSRPITPTTAMLVADLRRSSREDTCWSAAYSLAETCPAPTPMTWEFLKRMMSWEGGLGRAYRRFGFFFREDVKRDGFLRLCGGRLYADLGLEAASCFGEWPLSHDFDALRQNPALASHPQPKPDWKRARASFWLKLPWYLWKLASAQRRLTAARAPFAGEFAAWEKAVRERAAGTPRAASVAEFRERFRQAAGEAAEMAIAASILASAEWERTPAGKRGELRAWIPSELAHRGPAEMELAEPRWRERPAELERLSRDAPPGRDAEGIYALRERGKDAFLRATETLRLDLLELGRRTGLGTDVFFLTPDELDRPDATVAARRRREREALLRIPLPTLVFSRGEAAAATSGAGIAPGTAEGIAWHPASAAEAPPADAVLVVPSLDPSWTLLYSRVKAVVTGRGGLLSHGAIVARELGVPCVLWPEARERVPEGARVEVDGAKGTVRVVKVPD
ncbi:MAG: pyruvate water [Planctomycetota bacterium]|nr:MAG: pyruvate water [Planctomycetota bacterium]